VTEDRRGRHLPLDAHLHTDLSPDSDVPIDVYAQQAAELGIRELAITDHLDFEPGAPAFGYSTFADRERVVRDAAERWEPQGVTIRFGIELTYDRSWEGEIRDHLARHAYDFTIGSVHDRVRSPYHPANVGGWVAGRSLAEIVAPAFDEVAAAAHSGLFDTIGHLDVVKRYINPHVLPADLAARPDLREPVLRALVESGTSLEVNTSGLRHPVRETYPTAETVERFRALGGRRVTVGSDAHRADAFAFGLEEGYRILARAEFEELTFRRGGSRVAVALPQRFRS
jgi:histidinol-phosphatase (PHP family)